MRRQLGYVALLWAALAGLLWPTAGFAYSGYLATFNSRYGTTGTRLDTCYTCHTTGFAWNPYGTDVRTQLNAGKTIDQALAVIEPVDSDGDGFTNVVEIGALTSPGDPSDMPAVSPGTLSSGSVSPPSGDLWTTYTYTVEYTNPDDVAPDSVWVAIWSQHANRSFWSLMTASNAGDTNYTDGKWYQYVTGPEAGSQAYRFAANVSGMWIYWPEPSGTYALGPQIDPVVLSSGYVTPTAGTSSTEFAFRVKYWHTGNLAPDVVWVAIWSQSQDAPTWYQTWPYDSSDTNYLDGKWYTLHLHGLDASGHAFRFAARRGTDWAYWPDPPGTYADGPAVSPP